MTILKDGLNLARLKRSIGRDHADPRPLFPIQVAKYMEEMKKELNDHSSVKTAERLGISTSTIADFVNMLKSPRKFDDVWGWKENKGRIPWSMFRRVGDFYQKKNYFRREFWQASKWCSKG